MIFPLIYAIKWILKQFVGFRNMKGLFEKIINSPIFFHVLQA
jgi:hypothetical protein